MVQKTRAIGPRSWGTLLFAVSAAFSPIASGQSSSALAYTVGTPRPISPADGTTTPSAQATQRQNPFLGSVQSQNTGKRLELSLTAAIERGLRYNLGLIESNQASADVRAERLRALSALLPQISAEGRQVYENISYKEIGLKLPAIPGLPALPSTSGGFGYQDARVSFTQSLYSAELHNQYRARKSDEQASILRIHDSRDVVVLAVGTAYLQVVASAARVQTAKSELASAEELDRQMANQLKSEISPEIDSLRAQVERQSAEQRLTVAGNQLEKDKLTLARIIGLAIDQNFALTDSLAYHPLPEMTAEAVTEDALRSRSDLRSAEASVRAAAFNVRAQKDQRLPVVSVSANYGGAGSNIGNFSQVYTIAGNVALPLYTGGRIRADIEQAQQDLARRQAEYEDLKGRVGYDVRVAWLDLHASESSVKVAERNKSLAQRALTQSRDRYANGVTNYLEVVQAEETLTAASENYIESLFSFNVAMISFARAQGGAETKLAEFLGGK
ncbi:MAG TPA: TolC family protein [Bryobacteraceae bacterium]|jgi:outer membrane protein TolC|nr:TolC family protein [Bryobacteraceae bacterium]